MSFSAEMRDFLTAYKTGQSINASRTDQDYKEAKTEAEKLKTERDNDPDTLKTAKEKAIADLQNVRSTMSARGAGLTDAAARTAIAARTADAVVDRNKADAELRRAQAAVYGAPQPGSGLSPTGAIQPGAGPVLGTPGVLPTPGAIPLPASTLSDTEEFEDGGLVDDGDGADDEGVLDVDAIPTPAGAPTDVSAQSRQPATRGLNGVISPALIEDARHAGMTWGINKAGLNQAGAIKTPAAMLKAKQIAQGMGGLTEEEMAAARQAVDPEGKLPEGQRNLAALGSVYQFWANKGEPEKAGRVAFQMIQHYRGASQRYAAIAAKAAEGGDMDLATKAALKSYANVPDGKEIALEPSPDGKGLVYYYTDANGNEIAKGIATPQQLAASAMGLATGGFDRALLSAAGATQDTGAVKAGGKPPSSADRAKEAENIDGEITKMKATWSGMEGNKGKPVDEEMWSEIGNAAQHIYQQNPRITAGEAARAANKMLSMGDDPEKPGFKIKPGEDGKPSTVDFGGKLRLQLDDDQLEQVLNARAARVKVATDKINKDMEDSEKPGFVDKTIDAGKEAVGAIRNMDLPTTAAAKAVGSGVAKAGEMLKQFYGIDGVLDVVPHEMQQRIGSDLRKIDDIVRRNLHNPMQNPGAIPVDEGDRPL